jgi:hypothetical protein
MIALGNALNVPHSPLKKELDFIMNSADEELVDGDNYLAVPILSALSDLSLRNYRQASSFALTQFMFFKT